MEKAILVLDKPSSCVKCKMYHSGGEYFAPYCSANDKSIYDIDKVADTCPLRPLPERKVVTSDDVAGAVAVKFGWNNCLNEILKEEEKW